MCYTSCMVDPRIEAPDTGDDTEPAPIPAFTGWTPVDPANRLPVRDSDVPSEDVPF